MTSRPQHTLLPATCLLAALGCSPSTSPDTTRSVVLVVVDTFRRDRLGSYGSDAGLTPALDRLAGEAARFERAYATAPWTMPSVGSMLSGLYPWRFKTGQEPFEPLPEAVETLAEILRGHGYATGAVVSHFLLGRRFGFSQGFDHHDEGEAVGHGHVSTPGVTRRAIRLLEAAARWTGPFFLFVHYFDPHYAYVDHPEIHRATLPGGRIAGGEPIEALRNMSDQLSEGEIQALRDLYDEEVRFTDQGVGELLDALRQFGLYDRVVLSVVADHGEELLERGWLGHTRTLHEELVAVPWIVRAPGVVPTTVAVPVSMVSLTPTLLELAGIPAGGRSFDGPSLASVVRGEQPPPEDPVWLDVDFQAVEAHDRVKNTRQRGLVWNGHKLVHDRQSGRRSLYDLDADPGELHDLADALPELAAELAARLDRPPGNGSSLSDTEPATESPVDAEMREKLHALGYMRE